MREAMRWYDEIFWFLGFYVFCKLVTEVFGAFLIFCVGMAAGKVNPISVDKVHEVISNATLPVSQFYACVYSKIFVTGQNLVVAHPFIAAHSELVVAFGTVVVCVPMLIFLYYQIRRLSFNKKGGKK